MQENKPILQDLQTTLCSIVNHMVGKVKRQIKFEFNDAINQLRAQIQKLRTRLASVTACKCSNQNQNKLSSSPKLSEQRLGECQINYKTKREDKDQLQAQKVQKLKKPTSYSLQKLDLKKQNAIAPQFVELKNKLAEAKRMKIEGTQVQYSNDRDFYPFQGIWHAIEFPQPYQSAKQWVYSLKVQFKGLIFFDLQKSSDLNEDINFLTKNDFLNLSILRLKNNNIGDKEIQLLIKRGFPNLQHFYLENNKLGNSGFKHLTNDSLPNLKEIFLHNNKIGDEGCKYLAKGSLMNLKELWLPRNLIGKEGVKHLATGSTKNLYKLDLSNNSRLRDEDMKILAEGKFPNLWGLYLNEIRMSDEGIKNLSKGNFPNLTQLFLQGNRIRDQGCHYLSEGSFPKLSSIFLGGNPIQKKREMYELLKKKLPKASNVNL